MYVCPAFFSFIEQITNMTTKYTYKEIWIIAYPSLISLIMGTADKWPDNAFLGCVGEVELGASAIAGVYYLAIFISDSV